MSPNVSMPLPVMGNRVSKVGSAVPYLAALLIAGLVCPSLFVGLPPHTHDHNFHLANAVETERLLRSGRLVGWSDFQLGGHLANGFYPPAVSVAIAALHWISPVPLSWDAAYSIIFLGFLATFSIGLFLLARQIVSTWAALACAAVALLWDRGGLFNGGWYFYLDLGVWPFGFSLAWTLAALAALPRTFNEPGIGRVWTVATLCALAVLTHPFALLILPPLAALQVAVWSSMRRISARSIGWTLAAIALGLALAAWWWVPFVIRGGEMDSYIVPPASLGQLWRQLATGAGGDLISWWVFASALVGTWLAWRRREPWGRWCVLAGWGLMLGSTKLPYLALGIDVDRGWLANLQLIRLQAVARLLLIALAILPLFLAAKYIRRRARGLHRASLLAAAAAASCVIGIGLYAAPGHLKLPRGGAPHRPTCYSKGEELELRELLDAIRPFLADHRIAVDNHCLVLAASLIEAPFFKIGQTPADLFGGKFSTQDAGVLGRLGVAVVLSDGPRTGPLADLPLLRRRGRFEARSLTPLSRVEVSDPAARIAVERWSDEDIRLRLDAPQETDIRLWVNFSPQWEARQGDGRLPVQVESVGPARLIGVRAFPGDVRLRFRVSPSTRLCQGISLLTLAAMLVSLGRDFLRKRGFPLLAAGSDSSAAAP